MTEERINERVYLEISEEDRNGILMEFCFGSEVGVSMTFHIVHMVVT
jgi:hypothetical protein